jgi:L-iditol 2-dehydrogenase
MAEPLAAAIHAVGRGTEAEEVAVLGGGPMGLMLASLLLAQGRSVTLADRHAARREQATGLGARGVEHLGRHELVFEAVGRPEAWRAAISAAAPGGAVVLVGGCPKGAEVPLPADLMHYEELDMRGSFHHSRDEVHRALEMLASGRLRLGSLLGERISLEELSRALASPTGGPARKWVVDPRA